MILPHIIARYASIQTLRQDAWHRSALTLLRPRKSPARAGLSRIKREVWNRSQHWNAY